MKRLRAGRPRLDPHGKGTIAVSRELASRLDAIARAWMPEPISRMKLAERMLEEAVRELEAGRKNEASLALPDIASGDIPRSPR